MSPSPTEGAAPGAPVELIVAPDAETLAASVAARLVTEVRDAVRRRGRAHVVLTGGGVGTAVLAALADADVDRAVPWEGVDLWWGDERYLPAGDAERNETSARAALVDRVGIPTHRVHAMPASGTSSLEQAAADYAAELARAAADDRTAGDVGASPRAGRWAAERAAAATPGELDVPAFDVVLLGLGPDGHVASLFPGHPACHAGGTTVAVRESPKPPPERISLTFAALRSARQVWLLAAGESKADAVGSVLSPADLPVPGALVKGKERTLLLADRGAAAGTASPR